MDLSFFVLRSSSRGCGGVVVKWIFWSRETQNSRGKLGRNRSLHFGCGLARGVMWRWKFLRHWG